MIGSFPRVSKESPFFDCFSHLSPSRLFRVFGSPTSCHYSFAVVCTTSHSLLHLRKSVVAKSLLLASLKSTLLHLFETSFRPLSTVPLRTVPCREAIRKNLQRAIYTGTSIGNYSVEKYCWKKNRCCDQRELEDIESWRRRGSPLCLGYIHRRKDTVLIVSTAKTISKT